MVMVMVMVVAMKRDAVFVPQQDGYFLSWHNLFNNYKTNLLAYP